jgi:hypothetical protein
MMMGWGDKENQKPLSYFILHPSYFTLHTSPFILHPSYFTLHTSPFILHPSYFTLHTSPFILHTLFPTQDSPTQDSDLRTPA